MKKEIRKYLSARIIELLWNILPKGDFKKEFAEFITENISKL